MNNVTANPTIDVEVAEPTIQRTTEPMIVVTLPSMIAPVERLKPVLIDVWIDLLDVLKEVEGIEGLTLLEVKVKKGNRKDLGRPTTTPIQNKEALMSFLADK